MAAHPFGPIENQLIVGYYKRGFSPARVRLDLKTKTKHKVPNSANPVQSLLSEPVFYGWSPANGNSSSHDFRVYLQCFDELEIRDLLSRGLGYRITFTMPEQEIRTEDPTSWPQAMCEILDLTGETCLVKSSLMTTKIVILDQYTRLKTTFVQHLIKYRMLKFEQTLYHLKIVENETDEYLFPVYSPPGSSIDERHLAAAERHQPVLGHYRRMVEGSVGDCAASCTLYLTAAFRFFKSRHNKITNLEKRKLQTFVLGAARDLKHLFAYVQSKSRELMVPEATKKRLPRLVNDLESDIRKWLDDEGPFPKYLWVSMIEEIHDLGIFETMSKSGSFPPVAAKNIRRPSKPTNEPKKYFDVQGLFTIEPLGFFIRTAFDPKLPRFTTQSIHLLTKSFVYEIEPITGIPGLIKPDDRDANVIDILEYWTEDCRGIEDDGQMCLLPEHDMLLYCRQYFGGAAADNFFDVCHLMDLHVAYECGLKPSKQPAAHEFAMFSVKGLSAHQLVRYGLLLCHEDQEKFTVGIYLLDTTDITKAPSHSETSFTVLAGPEGFLPLVCCMFLTYGQTQIYLMGEYQNEDEDSTGLWLCLIKRNRRSLTLELKHQQSLVLEDIYNTRLETKILEFENNRVFACAFTPDCRLWAFMYWRGRFVCAGRQRGGTCNPFELNSVFSSLQEIKTLDRPLGLLGYLRPDLRKADAQEHECVEIRFRC